MTIENETNPVAALKDLSGLNWDQIGRALGVAARTARLIGLGETGEHSGSASAHQIAEALLAEVAALPGNTPEERRAVLLASGAGPSVFAAWLKRAPKHQRIQYTSMDIFKDSLQQDKR